MKRFLSLLAMLILVTIGFPSFTFSQDVPPGYRRICENGICRLVRIRPQVSVAAPAIVQYRTVPGVGSETPFARTMSFVADDDEQSTQYVSASRTVVRVSGTCPCVTTGVCQCAPGTCSCPGCPMSVSVGNVAYAPTVTYSAPVQYTTTSPYVYYSVAAPTVMAAQPAFASSTLVGGGAVTKSYDALGNVYTSRNVRGAYARKVERHIHKGVKLGLE